MNTSEHLNIEDDVVEELKEFSLYLHEKNAIQEKINLLDDDDKMNVAALSIIEKNNIIGDKPIEPEEIYYKMPPSMEYNYEPSLKKYNMHKIITMIFAGLTALFLFLTISQNDMFWLGFVFFNIFVIFIDMVVFLFPNKREYESIYSKYKTAKNDYNIYLSRKEQYQKNLEEYKNKKEHYEEVLQKTIEKVKKEILNDELVKAKNELKEYNTKMIKYEGIISPKYYKNIDEIIAIFENGRASNLTDAINIFESDEKANELIRLQKKYNSDLEEERIRQNFLDEEREREERVRAKNERHRYEKEMEQEKKRRQDEERLRQREKDEERREQKRIKAAEERAGRLQCSSCASRTFCSFYSNNKGNCASFKSK